MSFLSLSSALIAAGIAIPVLVAMYFLKLRRRMLEVSSTLLWKRAIQDLQVNSPFQKMKRNLLLLLQLLLLLGLLLALARPTFKGGIKAGQRIIIVVDQSASMNATDEAPTRLDRARVLARKLVDDLDGGSAMVVTFAHQARVLQPFTTDKTLLKEKIDAIEATDQLSNLGPALRLIEPYVAPKAPGAPPGAPPGAGAGAGAAGAPAGPGGGGASPAIPIFVLSDGRLTDESNLSLQGGDLRLLQLGQDPGKRAPDNVAIVALSARRDLDKPQHFRVFARLANYGPQTVKTNLTLGAGASLDVHSVDVPAWNDVDSEPGLAEAAFDLSVSDNVLVTVKHDHNDDLVADNSASIVLGRSQQIRVLLVTGAGNWPVERASKLVTGVEEVQTLPPAQYEKQFGSNLEGLRRSTAAGGGTGSAAGGFDLIIFDRYSPKAVPPVSTLSFAGVPPIPGLARIPTSASEPHTQGVLNWERDDPFLANVTLDNLQMVDPGRLALPETARTLAVGLAGPVMAVVPWQHNTHVVLSFNVLQTIWPLQQSFITFMTNAIQGLALGSSDFGLSYQCGETIAVPAQPGVKQVTYRGPDGVTLTATVDAGQAVLPTFTRTGIYVCDDGVLPPLDHLAVNLCDKTESNTRPLPQLQVAAATTATITQAAVSRQEVWRWFIWAALGLLLIEWMVYTRRMHL